MSVGHPDNSGLFMSDEGYQFIESWEAFKPKRYKDQAGIWTIGIGETGPKAQVEGYVMSYQEAKTLLRQHVRGDENTVKKHVKVPLTQKQFDALVSWQYNTGGLVGSTLLRVLNAGDYIGAVEQMRRWNKITDPKTGKKVVSKGLVNRREAEAVMFDLGSVIDRPEEVAPSETNAVAENTDKPILLTKTGVGTMISGGAATGAIIADMAELGGDVSETAVTLAPHADKGTTFYTVMLTLVIVGTVLALIGRWHVRRKAGG